MGIKDLYKIIKKHAPEQMVTRHLSEFAGYSVAVDVSIFFYKYAKTIGKGWESTFIVLLSKLKKHGIEIICIFDGDSPPPEKTEERLRRREASAKAIGRLEECIRVRDLVQDEYMMGGYLALDDAFAAKCKKLAGFKRGFINVTNFHDPGETVDALNGTIERLTRQTTPITVEYKLRAMEVVKLLGIACVEAVGEAETLCSYLAVTGRVDAVLTEDTDVLAYGVPIMMAFKQFKMREEKVVCIHYESLCESLGLSPQGFTDLCILLSCDYNSRVKGYPPDGKKRKKPVSLGAVGAWNMISLCGDLTAALEYIPDPEPLMIERCRELFTPRTDGIDPSLLKIPHNSYPLYEQLDTFLTDNKLYTKIEYIEKCWRPAELVNVNSSDTLSSTMSEEDSSA